MTPRFTIPQLIAGLLLLDGAVVGLAPLVRGGSELDTVLLFGLAFGQLGLVASWLVLGGSSWRMRWTAALVSLLLWSGFWMVGLRAPGWSAALSISVPVFSGCALLVLPLRLKGYRWLTRDQLPADVSPASLSSNQFTLAAMLRWTTLAALLAVATRYADFPSVPLIEILLPLGLAAVLSPVATGLFSMQLSGLLRAALLLGSAVVCGIVVAPLDAAPEPWLWPVMYLVEAVVLLIGFSVCERAEMRIFRDTAHARPDADEPVVTSSTSAE